MLCSIKSPYNFRVKPPFATPSQGVLDPPMLVIMLVTALRVFVESCKHPGSISNSGGVLINKADHDDLSKMAKLMLLLCVLEVMNGKELQRPNAEHLYMSYMHTRTLHSCTRYALKAHQLMSFKITQVQVSNLS